MTWNIAATAVLSALSAILGASLAYVFTRRREHEADWRKLKFNCYREYILALSGIVEGRSTSTSQQRYSDAMNSMVLVAPPAVLRSLYAFQDYIGYKNKKRDMVQYERLQNDLFRAIRDDVHPGGAGDSAEHSFLIIGVPPSTPQD